jgi:hypothetical protein
MVRDNAFWQGYRIATVGSDERRQASRFHALGAMAVHVPSQERHGNTRMTIPLLERIANQGVGLSNMPLAGLFF